MHVGKGFLRRRLAAFSGDDSGQTVVIVALMFSVLLGFTALAIDVGLYYAERRSLQDAVDAAALACVRAYSQANATDDDAQQAAEDILENFNLKGSLQNLFDDYVVPEIDDLAAANYYDNNISAENLKNGVLPQLSPYMGCRVAVYVDMPTVLIKIASPDLQTLALSARAYAIAKGGMLPIVIPKYSNGPGPGNGSESQFIHHTMANASDYQCTVTSDSGCTAATSTSPGREFILFGQGQEAQQGGNQFRGYIALDVRDFTTTDGGSPAALVHTSYNGVDPDESVNNLKDYEAHWIDEGYPGPDVCTVISNNFQPCAQIAIIDGTSAGIFIDHFADRYDLGDKILAQLYDGTVKTIPNFTINFPSLVVSSPTQTLGTQSIAFTFSDQFADSEAQVNLYFYPDDGTITGGSGDSRNPWRSNTDCDDINAGCTASSGNLSSTAVTTTNTTEASYNFSWTGITTNVVPQGIYAVFLKGVGTAPYATTEQIQVVSVNVNDQDRQFHLTDSDTYVNTPDTSTNATYTISVTDSSAASERWQNPDVNNITLQIDQCPKSGSTTLTCYFGTTSPGTQSQTITALTTNVTLTVDPSTETATATTGTTYTGWLRAYGTDASNNKVTKILKIRTGVGVSSGGTTDYVDVIGFAVFQITSVDSNSVSGKAITGAFENINDDGLAIGKKYGLVPWETD